ncbi:MAG: class I SAM-dependent methyltransferase [Ignavibacteria bacterium]|nr:class I SAM-dependent methyltransferase [Ignavibacteria bacterium]
MIKKDKPDYIGADYKFDTLLSSSVLDELPLWSAPFGLSLLDEVKYFKNIKALDIGFGSGFPLIELAQRLGKTSIVYGIDPWPPSHKRTLYKLDYHKITNVKLIKGAAEKIPLEDNSIDLIVSNNGTNNVRDVDKVFSECRRISKKGARFIIAVNLDGTMIEFYDEYFKALKKRGMKNEIEKLRKHIYDKRRPLKELKSHFSNNGFKIDKVTLKEFKMKFSDAESFFNHTLIKIGFLDSWKKILPPNTSSDILIEITKELNKSNKHGLVFSIPYAIINSVKA